jgi:hypothetical protein
MRRPAIALLLLLSLINTRETSAQVYDDGASRNVTRPVIIEDETILSADAMNTVAHLLSPNLPEWPKDLRASASVGFAGKSVELNGAHIRFLSVTTANEVLKPSEEDMIRLWEVARKQLEAELNRITGDVAKAQRKRLDSEIQQIEATQPMESDVTELIAQLAERQAESAGAEGNFSQGLAEAFSKQRELKLRDAGVRARREAIEHRIDELRKIADASAEADPILAELAKLVDIRRKQLDTVRTLNQLGKEGGTGFQLSEAEGVLATALVEWTKAKQDAAERAGGGHLRALNDELSKLLVESAEIEGQRKELEKIIVDIRKDVRDMALAMGEAESLKAKIQTLRGRVAEEDARINDLRREYERQAPQSVTLRPLTVDKIEPSEPEASAPGASE